MKEPTSMTQNSAVIGIRILYWNFENFGRSKGGVRFAVRSIRESKPRIRAGRTVKMQSMLMRTPLARASPTSAPMVKLINTRASSPAKVVRELPLMALKDRARACSMVSYLSARMCRCCR